MTVKERKLKATIRRLQREAASLARRTLARQEKAEKAALRMKAEKQKLKEAKAESKKQKAAERAGKPPAKRKGARYRDSRGHYVSYEVWVQEHMQRKFDKEWEPATEKSSKELAKLYAIDAEKKGALDRMVKRMVKGVEESNFDLVVSPGESIVTNKVRWEAAFTIQGLPKGEVLIQKDMLTKALFAIIDRTPKRARRGLMISFAFLSEDALFLFYSRKKVIFENRFLDTQNPREFGLLIIKMQSLFDSMTKASFDVSGLRMMLYYDNSVAKEGLEEVVKTARREKGR